MADSGTFGIRFSPRAYVTGTFELHDNEIYNNIELIGIDPSSGRELRLRGSVENWHPILSTAKAVKKTTKKGSK